MKLKASEKHTNFASQIVGRKPISSQVLKGTITEISFVSPQKFIIPLNKNCHPIGSEDSSFESIDYLKIFGTEECSEILSQDELTIRLLMCITNISLPMQFDRNNKDLNHLIYVCVEKTIKDTKENRSKKIPFVPFFRFATNSFQSSIQSSLVDNIAAAFTFSGKEITVYYNKRLENHNIKNDIQTPKIFRPHDTGNFHFLSRIITRWPSDNFYENAINKVELNEIDEQYQAKKEYDKKLAEFEENNKLFINSISESIKEEIALQQK